MTAIDALEADRTHFWSKAAAASFGLWSLALPISAGLVINKMDTVSRDLSNLSTRLDNYILNSERRITLIEERQQFVLRTLEGNGLIYRSNGNGENRRGP
jgi:hypothetical protein